MKKLFIYYNFILVTVMSISGFANSQNNFQILSSVLFYPLFIYFTLAVLPRRQKALTIPQATIVTTKKSKKHKGETEEVILQKQPDEGSLPRLKLDADRRMFIKLIASAGLSVFFLSLFTKKAHAAFFGSVPGPGTVAIKDSAGTIVDPAIKQPTDGYRIARTDDSTSTAYYGFINKDGAWFIMREESDGTYKYQRGSSNFQTSGWDIRNTSLTYQDFDNVF